MDCIRLTMECEKCCYKAIFQVLTSSSPITSWNGCLTLNRNNRRGPNVIKVFCLSSFSEINVSPVFWTRWLILSVMIYYWPHYILPECFLIYSVHFSTKTLKSYNVVLYYEILVKIYWKDWRPTKIMKQNFILL